MSEQLAQLNHDIWQPFASSYADVDIDAFVSLFTEDLVRVDAKRGVITGRTGMAEETSSFFATIRERGDLLAIDFRFTERLATNGLASERGVFRAVVNPKDEPSRAVYGRFHTIARKDGGTWRLAVDYDRDDATEDDFTLAAAVDDFTPFTPG